MVRYMQLSLLYLAYRRLTNSISLELWMCEQRVYIYAMNQKVYFRLCTDIGRSAYYSAVPWQCTYVYSMLAAQPPVPWSCSEWWPQYYRLWVCVPPMDISPTCTLRDSKLLLLFFRFWHGKLKLRVHLGNWFSPSTHGWWGGMRKAWFPARKIYSILNLGIEDLNRVWYAGFEAELTRNSLEPLRWDPFGDGIFCLQSKAFPKFPSPAHDSRVQHIR